MKTKIIKKSVSIVLTLLMMLSTIPISAVSADEIIEGTTEDGFKYTIKNEEVTITDYTQYNTEVVIPNTIEGYKVTKIGSYAFYWDHPYITSIVLPIHLKEIGIQAFASCENLDNVIIPSNVQYIGDGAFSKCFKLSNIQIKGNIKYMGSGVFYNTAFQKNSNNWNNNILYLSSILIEANDIVGHCNIKNGTTTIAKRAFWNCVHLKSISLPCTIENICDVAFYTDSAYSNFENHLTDVYYNGTEQKWNSITLTQKTMICLTQESTSIPSLHILLQIQKQASQLTLLPTLNSRYLISPVQKRLTKQISCFHIQLQQKFMILH